MIKWNWICCITYGRALNSNVIIVWTAIIAPTTIGTIAEVLLVAGARDAAQPYGSNSSLWHGWPTKSFNAVFKSKFTTDHICIFHIPTIFANCSPFAVVVNLNATCAVGTLWTSQLNGNCFIYKRWRECPGETDSNSLMAMPNRPKLLLRRRD